MLLQTNSYIVPKEKRAAHNRLMQRFRQVLQHIGCDHFEVYEQVGANWTGADSSGRFVQLMKFRDRKHCQAVQLVERQDPAAQALVREFCDLINFPYQEQQGLFAHGYYQAVIEPIRTKPGELAFHNFDGEPDPVDAAKRIAAGLPDTPHTIDSPEIPEGLQDPVQDAFVSTDAETDDAVLDDAGIENAVTSEFDPTKGDALNGDASDIEASAFDEPKPDLAKEAPVKDAPVKDAPSKDAAAKDAAAKDD